MWKKETTAETVSNGKLDFAMTAFLSVLLVVAVPSWCALLPQRISDENAQISITDGTGLIEMKRGIGGKALCADEILSVRMEKEVEPVPEPEDEETSEETSATPTDEIHYELVSVPVYDLYDDSGDYTETDQSASFDSQTAGAWAQTSEDVGKDYSWVNSSTFAALSSQGKISLLGEMAQEDQRRSGILASVTMAQCILESGWMRSELTKQGENYFGIKACALDNNFDGSYWYGDTIDMETSEEYVEGELVKITASFRHYENAWQSMRDHSAYLVNAMNGDEPRYRHIAYIRDYRQAVQLIKDGGYATSSTYVDSVCAVIEKYRLWEWDIQDGADPSMAERLIVSSNHN